ncbi:MAG TPA: 4-phosphoerythronate dehydrogenase PdxB [Bacteroidales bacterium]|nr:4-phosphoerythronate dehydrogenase PdxB [Bacteroidales bacterium]
MKIVADNKIPYLKGLLEPYAEVVYLSGKEIRKEDILDADAILIRTRTICNRDLLEGTKVRFIGTATIGFDHIDTDYCAVKNIKWVNAPGCNARAVAQYVISSMLNFSRKYNFNLAEKTIGIIGVGQCGQKVERFARLLGMEVLLYDPPRARNEGEKNFISMERLLADSDIITFHPNLEKEGPDKTWHMADAAFFTKLKKRVFIINTARGSIIETNVLKSAIRDGKVIDCAIDCWENEPDIDLELLERAMIATPHIAGYSSDGKANATRTVVEQLNMFLELSMPPKVCLELPVPEEPVLKIHKNSPHKIASALLYAYDPVKDSEVLKKSPTSFEEIRGKYVFRREYKAFRIVNLAETEAELLRAFGFQTPPRNEVNHTDDYRE